MDMNGKTVLITGSTDGVGRYVAAQLAAQGAKVLIHGRDVARPGAPALTRAREPTMHSRKLAIRPRC